MTIIVRGIALGELTGENAWRIFFKELLVGLTTGVAIGAIICGLGYIWERNMIFGIVIGIAMILNMMAATTSGFIVPVVLKKLKVDPALASAVFVTTVTDVLGFFFFLGLATMFIQYLI
ncbi:magnesium transporter [Clostridium butyricum E4 str. BoNT E BL5262]|uniref:Magnesium transporter n=1 Tax=Clostridium butyricum E4 str. BoNT E BL5262 TaxID=632245 RepID=C4ICD8_CLOBU|nr:magnesium transporter [Clostridium butyricum E4 str. BoNT E BL5262]